MKNRLTVKEEALLFGGRDKWCTYSIPDKDIPSIRTSDGPNGLRIEISDNELGFGQAKPATALPTASLMACSFDQKLIYEYGTILAEECMQEGIDIILGPGVCHKRSPLCGRNFEYFSEDPLLSGKEAAAYIQGVQSKGIGTSLKHFAGNSREFARLVADSIIDERTLHEIYLKQFMIAIREGHPWTIMTAYNLLNGTYCAENKALMEEARKEGFDGAFISDWGGVSDPVASAAAGLSLEMPGGNIGIQKCIEKGIEDGTLKKEQLDQDIDYLLHTVDKCSHYERKKYDRNAHLAFARKAAEQSAVLLKNEDDILPLKKEESIALIGAFAKNPVTGAAGSANVLPYAEDNLYMALKERNIPFQYEPGYGFNNEESLRKRAVSLAETKDKVILVCGLMEGIESEGYDRKNMRLPSSQLALIEEVTKVNPNVVIILECGAPVELPFVSNVKGILLMYLAGCQSGKACASLLYGDVNPAGRLAETWPKKLEDTPSYHNFSQYVHSVQYRETIYTGYRYYDTFDIPVCFPFGYGLSYASFTVSDMQVKEKDHALLITLKVKNTGHTDGADVIELYAGMKESRIAREKKWLIGFDKVYLKAGEEKEVTVTTDIDALKYYDVKLHQMSLEEGNYTIMGCASVSEILCKEDIYLSGNTEPYSTIQKSYFHVEEDGLQVRKSDFETMLGKKIPDEEEMKPFNADTTIGELSRKKLGKVVNWVVHLVVRYGNISGVDDESVRVMPLRQLLFIDGASWDLVNDIASYMNKHEWSRLHKIIKEFFGGRKK